MHPILQMSKLRLKEGKQLAQSDSHKQHNSLANNNHSDHSQCPLYQETVSTEHSICIIYLVTFLFPLPPPSSEAEAQRNQSLNNLSLTNEVLAGPIANVPFCPSFTEVPSLKGSITSEGRQNTAIKRETYLRAY